MCPTAALPSESEIATLMQLFYLKAERDERLGPIFAIAHQDWAGYSDAPADARTGNPLSAESHHAA